MRVLMLSPTIPWPLNLGSRIRIYHGLRELVRAGHEVTLLCMAHEPYESSDLEVLRSHCQELQVVSIPRRTRNWGAGKAFFSLKPYGVVKYASPGFGRRVAEAISKSYNILWVHFLETLVYLPEFDSKRKPVVILDQHNADERFWATYVRQGPPWVRLFARQNLWKLRRFQQAVLQKVDVVLSVSEEDAAFTRTRLPNPATKVWVLPNGVDTESHLSQGGAERQNRIILCGAMDVMMNIDAAERFAHRIFPRVREAVPDAEFWIVGKDPTPTVQGLEVLAGVCVTGRVEDVRSYYAQAKVAVAPFRYGGGTKLKVMEAMALGVPVVATPVGCQGINAIPGEHIFLEDKDEAFAERVITLLQDEILRRNVAAAARQLVEQKYSWHNILVEAIGRLEWLVESSK